MGTCNRCGVEIRAGYYCSRCYAYNRKHPEGVYCIPPDGTMAYATNGDPICHECGEAHRKLGNHVYQQHHMSINEYKDKHKLYHSVKLTHKDYQRQMADYVTQYYDVVVADNLVDKGVATRYTPGQPVEGRGKHL